jgi:hypothetical protein
MTVPTDEKLYNKVKTDIYIKYPNHSAYRSGLLVKKYKEEFIKKHPNKQPYKEPKPTNQQGLKRWFGENWTNQRGEVGYKYKSDVYRPNIRINKDTPVTFNELTKKELNKAMKEKASLGRVKKFKK